MSIHVLRSEYGLAGITMRYEDGGKVQIYKLGDKEIRFGPMVSNEEIVAAFKAASKEAE